MHTNCSVPKPKCTLENLNVPTALPFENLPNSGWSIGELPQVTEEWAILRILEVFGRVYEELPNGGAFVSVGAYI